jgi:hypothetical protein
LVRPRPRAIDARPDLRAQSHSHPSRRVHDRYSTPPNRSTPIDYSCVGRAGHGFHPVQECLLLSRRAFLPAAATAPWPHRPSRSWRTGVIGGRVDQAWSRFSSTTLTVDPQYLGAVLPRAFDGGVLVPPDDARDQAAPVAGVPRCRPWPSRRCECPSSRPGAGRNGRAQWGSASRASRGRAGNGRTPATPTGFAAGRVGRALVVTQHGQDDHRDPPSGRIRHLDRVDLRRRRSRSARWLTVCVDSGRWHGRKSPQVSSACSLVLVTQFQQPPGAPRLRPRRTAPLRATVFLVCFRQAVW